MSSVSDRVLCLDKPCALVAVRSSPLLMAGSLCWLFAQAASPSLKLTCYATNYLTSFPSKPTRPQCTRTSLLRRGVLLSGVIFGLLHNSGGRNPAFAAWATGVGCLYGGAFLLTHNIWVPAVAHSVANFVSAAVWKARSLPAERTF